MGNKLKFLYIHCSATHGGLNVKAETIRDYHMNTLGWSRLGYRSVIELDGKIVKLVDANNDDIVQNSEITFGVKGMNRWSHHICYVGGVSPKTGNAKDTRTDAQKESMEKIVKYYLEHITDDIMILGHNQEARKSCPSFWVPDWLKEIGVPTKNMTHKDPYKQKNWLRQVNS